MGFIVCNKSQACFSEVRTAEINQEITDINDNELRMEFNFREGLACGH